MSVPIFNGNRIVAVAGVGNKETAYEDFDVKQLTLFMNSMWGILKNKRATDELKSTLEDKTALIQELYHRTRNNMQVICSMLSLKTQYLDDESIIQIFKEMKNRIYSMSLVHEKLYQAQHLSRLNLNSYFRELAHLNMENYRSALRRVDIKCDMESMQVLFDTAIPCGLVLNELLSNAFKFAFPENREGTITIGLHKPEPDVIEFSVSDDGVGVPEDFDWRQDGDFGLGIVKIVAEHQLQGTVEFDSQNGVTWKISFKKGFYSERV
jgi:two-component sensor histidine kinase